MIRLDAWQEQSGASQLIMTTRNASGGPPGNSPANHSALAHGVSALTGACCTAWTSTSL